MGIIGIGSGARAMHVCTLSSRVTESRGSLRAGFGWSQRMDPFTTSVKKRQGIRGDLVVVVYTTHGKAYKVAGISSDAEHNCPVDAL